MNFDAKKMTHAWAILTDQSNPDHWEPDRYNAAAFVKLLLETYEELIYKEGNMLTQTKNKVDDWDKFWNREPY